MTHGTARIGHRPSSDRKIGGPALCGTLNENQMVSFHKGSSEAGA